MLFRSDKVVAEVKELKFGEVLDARGDAAVVLQLATIDIIVPRTLRQRRTHNFIYCSLALPQSVQITELKSTYNLFTIE